MSGMRPCHDVVIATQWLVWVPVQMMFCGVGVGHLDS